MTLKDLLIEDWACGDHRRRGKFTAANTTQLSSNEDWRMWGRQQGKNLLPLWGGRRGGGQFWFAPEPEYNQAVDAWLEGWAEGIREAVEEL